MEQLQFLDRLDTGCAFSFPHRWEYYPEKEGIAAFGQYWGNESRSGHLHQYLHNTKTLKGLSNSDKIKLVWCLNFNVQTVRVTTYVNEGIWFNANSFTWLNRNCEIGWNRFLLCSCLDNNHRIICFVIFKYMFFYTCLAEGGHGYLKDWLWWGGLLTSKCNANQL